MKNGIGGGEGGALGDIAGLGVTLGAMGGVIGMTREALGDITGSSAQLARASAAWCPPPPPAGTAPVGQRTLPANSAPSASKAAGAQGPGHLDCACGQKGIASKFCPECGAKRPEPKPRTLGTAPAVRRASPGNSVPSAGQGGPSPRPRTPGTAPPAARRASPGNSARNAEKREVNEDGGIDL